MIKKKIGLIESALKYNRIMILLVAVFVLVGVFGLYIMPKQDFPTFTIRQGIVVGVYPGATSSQIENQITKPLEDFVFGFKEVKKNKTFSQSKNGMVILNIELNENVKDKDAFWSKFKHGLEVLKKQLPGGLLSLQAYDDFGETSAILVTLESKDKTYRELENYQKELKDRLRRVDGVSGLKSYGLQKEQISVYINQDKLANYGIGSNWVAYRLLSQGFSTMTGSVDNTQFASPIHITNPYNWEKDVAEQIIYSDANGNAIRLKDVARIQKEYPNTNPYIKNNGIKCILLSIEMRKGVNVVEMGKEVNQLLQTYQQELSKDVKIYSISDLSQIVSDSVDSFLKELLIAVLAVICVVIIFMPMRVAWVAATTIPITIFGAISLFFAFGIELNTIVLSALIVTLGMVVDDSIVIIDNYVEKLDEGESRWEAAISSPQKYFKSVLSATLLISITFFPFLLTTKGMFNDFLIAFPWAMTIILGLSLVVALLFTPFLQYTFIKRGLKKTIIEGKKDNKSLLDRIQIGYNWLLLKCFRYPKTTIVTGITIAVLGIIIFLSLPLRLMPFVERNQFAVEIYLPNGKAIQQTAIVADSLDHLLRKDKRVVSVTSFIGQGSPRFHDTYVPQLPSPNFAQFIVNTIGNKATTELLDEYSEKYSGYFPGAYVKFKQMDYSEARYPVEVRLSGDNIAAMKSYADSIKKCMHSVAELNLIRTNYEDQLPGVSVDLNNEEISRLGIDRSSVAISTSLNLGNGIPITNVWDDDYPISVVLKADRQQESNYKDVSDTYIPIMSGMTSVPLRQIAKVKADWTEGQIVRRNGVRTISILAEVRRGCNENRITRKLKNEIEKVDFPQEVSLSYGGMDEADGERLPQILGGLMIAIGIMFFVLLFHFKKISLAALSLGSTMLCFLGSSIGMLIMGVDISVTSILGIVSLMGILLRNGIIMLDYAEELRKEEHMSVIDSALQAGKRRMRPIFLTSMAAAVGVIPMVMGGSPLWTPLGTVIFFGTLITMVFISTILPVAYSVVYKDKDKKLEVIEVEEKEQSSK